MSSPLILITGGTGFIGAYIVHSALEAGYRLHLTTRPEKVKALQDKYGGEVEVFGVSDLSTGDYSEALRGVDAVIHSASPLPGADSPENIIRNAVAGTTNILNQVAKAGIKRVVVTSSFATISAMDDPKLLNPSYIVKGDEWNPTTKEQALDGTRDPMFVYAASKLFAEHEVWKFADKHPEIDITTILPVFVYGPYAPGFKADLGSGTNGIFYNVVLPKNPGKLLPQMSASGPWTVDVRDVAKAHVLALTALPTSKVGRKRLLVAGTCFTWKDAVEHLQDARPNLRNRLPDASDSPKIGICKIDTSRTQKVLGIKSFIDWRKTVEDTVDEFIRIEKEQKSVQIPLLY